MKDWDDVVQSMWDDPDLKGDLLLVGLAIAWCEKNHMEAKRCTPRRLHAREPIA